MADLQPERRDVYYSGRVQGVGFRYMVRALAADFAVAGYVRNLPDGRVELIVEGPREEVQGLLLAVRQSMRRYVSGVEELVVPPTGRFHGFEIRH